MNQAVVRPKWPSKRSPLDVFLLSGHMHMGAGSSMQLMKFLGAHPAVRSYGMATFRGHDSYDRYDKEAVKYLREGKINTIFIDPGTLGADGSLGFDAAPFLDDLRKQFQDVVVVLYTWDNCRKEFLNVHPRFKHYFFYLYSFVLSSPLEDYIPENNSLELIMQKCEYWYETRYEYDVALSFAGEDRNYAEEVAIQLRAEGARVFYDEFERPGLLGQNLFELHPVPKTPS